MSNSLDLILGPVCSGKSAELIRRITRYKIAGLSVLSIKPEIDTRSLLVRSRNGTSQDCHNLKSLNDLPKLLAEYQPTIIAIEEAQFFSDLYSTVRGLLFDNYHVIVSALDTDFYGEPFGDIPKLVTLSENVQKYTAVCMVCRKDRAIFSQKLRSGGSQIEIGDLELYEPRCINCFVPGGLK